MGAKASGTGVGSLIVVDTDIFIGHFRGEVGQHRVPLDESLNGRHNVLP